MCGFVGFFGKNTSQAGLPVLQKMAQTLVHRGPEDEAFWHDDNDEIYLGFRRLAFSDLTHAGRQPMVSSNGRYVLVFNGEVYNHELSSTLKSENVAFRGHSDTEILLETCALYGVHEGVKKLNGMFAFALYDRHEKCLHLVRDRFGIKPLYYMQHNGALVFASELKAFWPYLSEKPSINSVALSLYLSLGYVPDSLSIFDGILKVMPGTIMTFHYDQKVSGYTYWSMDQVVTQPKYSGSYGDFESELHELLKDSVKRTTIADVPVGSFLSGGIDSSLITALMQQENNNVSTFTIGFHEKAYNEAQHAKAVAQHLGTNHQEWYITEPEALNVVPKLATIYDEPFADPSAIPTYLVSKFARQSLKTVLSGDGGDELFGGYKRYAFLNTMWSCRKKHPCLRFLAPLIRIFPPSAWGRLAHVLPKAMQVQNMGQRLHTVANLLSQSSFEAAYYEFISLWQNHALRSLLKETYPLTPLENTFDLTPVEYMQWIDTIGYLPGDILTKLDRATMAVSLEGRVPLLDHRIVELAWKAPVHWKITDDGKGKHPLRQILKQYIPKELFDRPKMGFSVPVERWLREGLKDFSDQLLYDPSLGEFMDAAQIRTIWEQHKKGTLNEHGRLWPIIMFQNWRLNG